MIIYCYYSKFFNSLFLTNLPLSHSIFPHFNSLWSNDSAQVRGSGVYVLCCVSVYHLPVYLSIYLSSIYQSTYLFYFYLYLSSYPPLFLSLSLLLFTPKITFPPFSHIEVHRYSKMLCFHVCTVFMCQESFGHIDSQVSFTLTGGSAEKTIERSSWDCF